ncbi:MAG: bacillithiol biosynthesis cysteine-adding enzyme BshC [Sphingomonadales bacterium]|nr:bacillithiol biosynthesis cysteine-adding enzyme BshC [Sphingomonadales bacterium]
MHSYSISQHPLRQTGAFSPLVLDYLEGKAGFDIFPNTPDVESILRVARLQTEWDEVIRRKVYDRVMQLYSVLEHPQIDPIQLERIGQASTRFVVTAHQPILLGGPLYVLYKLSSVVALAKRLNKHPDARDLHFVPLYWVGDEDHDLEEIGHCHVLGKKIVWTPGKSGATGRLVIEEPEEFLSPLQEILGNRSEAVRWMALARDCYRKGITLLEATLRWTDTLFGSVGLVVFSGDDPQLKRAAIRLWEQEIHGRFSEKAALRGGEKLVEMGYHAQISPREINLFWIEEGSRQRLVRTPQGKWQAGEKTWPDDRSLWQQVQTEPEKLSPNVVLRSVYQEFLLRSSAFVGGPAEVAYWLQLYPVFQQAGVEFPPVLLRASLMLMDASMQNRLKQLAMKEVNLFRSKEDWVRIYLDQQSEVGLSGQEVLESIRKGYSRLSQEAASVDPSLKSFVLAELNKLEKSIEVIALRVLKARKQKNEVSIRRLQQLHERLFPCGQLQERHDNFLGWVASDPKEELLDFCRNFMDFPTHDLSLFRFSASLNDS